MQLSSVIKRIFLDYTEVYISHQMYFFNIIVVLKILFSWLKFVQTGSVYVKYSVGTSELLCLISFMWSC